MALTEETCRQIHSLAAGGERWMIDLRRRLHRIPEPAFEERETSLLLCGELSALGFDLRTEIGGTGILADLDLGGGACVALRADMDALAVEEATGAEHRSRHAGYSHCCGHDGNMAVALGAARILTGLAEHVNGRLRLVLQPAEEKGNGAVTMVDAGALTEPVPKAIFAAHGWPVLPAGTLGCRAGPMMASCDGIYVKIIGRGGHGARPERANSPLPGMAATLAALGDMNTPDRVVSICVARAGRVGNVIPDDAELAGSLRALGDDIRDRAFADITAAVETACDPLGLTSTVRFDEGTPAVVIPEAMYRLFRRTAAELLGEANSLEMATPTMGSEDFACYLHHVPGLLFRVGVGEDCAPLHNAAFDYNDDVLAGAAAVMAGMAVEVLQAGATL
jgi:amidohydrolase